VRLENIKVHQSKINQATTQLSDWTTRLIEAEQALAEQRGHFDACVLEIQARRKGTKK
jgi:hypothetical protein